MRLAKFIRENKTDIISEWESFARSLKPAAPDMGSLALRDHIQEILDFIVDDIDSKQSGHEQITKSHGEKPRSSEHSAAESHAALRLAAGFNIDQMVSEYRALRASVIKLWSFEETAPSREDILDLTRFNESIDQELTESISHYTKKVGHSKDLFLGILGHDLRTPLGASSMSAQLMLRMGTLKERETMLATQIVDCTYRASEIVTNLLDLTRARFGNGLPVIRGSMDIGFVSRKLVEEMRTIYPDRTINLDVSGELEGEWDKARIGQVFSNLIGNAVQYGFKDLPVSVRVEGAETEVIISVHNDGVPISDGTIERIFDSLIRGGEEDGDQQAEPAHLGLGLYITKEIVDAHGGTIDVTSSEKYGTTFTAKLPR